MPTRSGKPESMPPELRCVGSSSDVVDCPPWGRSKEGQPRRCCHWGAGLLLRWDHFHLLFTPLNQILLLLGGYCTGDNYRDERPIDVFVLNTSNYRWTEVLAPSSSYDLLSNVHLVYWSTFVQTGGQRQSHLPHYLLPRSQNLKTRLSEQNGLTKGEYNLNQMFYFDVNHRADMDTLWSRGATPSTFLEGGTTRLPAMFFTGETSVWINWGSVDFDKLI